MNNSNFPEPIVAPAPDQLVSHVKFWHAISGLYIWEYFITLDYEWGVIRGRLPYRWTIWIYSAARLFGLVSVILCFVTMDATTQINCQPWVLSSVVFLCSASIIAALLIVLRTIAIWNKNKVVVAVTILVWVTNIGFHINNIALIHSAWSPTQNNCVSDVGDYDAVDIIATMITDTLLLLVILSGLLVMRYRGGGVFGLTRLVWNQGIIWLVLGFAIEASQLVFTALHVDDQLHGLFASSSQVIMIIAATRMHRSLVNFSSGTSGMVHDVPKVTNLTSSKTKRSDTPLSALDRVEIAIHTTTELHRTSSKGDDDSITVNGTSGQRPESIGYPSGYSSDTEDTYVA